MKQSLAKKSKQLFAAWRDLPDSTPQRWFVVLAVFFGVLFAVITPPYAPPDEYGHLARAHQISHGRLTAERLGESTGGWTPASFTELGKIARADGYGLGEIPSLGTVPLDHQKQLPSIYPNLVVYNPLLYLPSAIGVGMGELLNLPAAYILLLARLCNLAAYILLMYWAIRLLPFGKWAGTIVALLPMHVLLAASVSADPVTTGLMALFLASILHLRARQKVIRPKEYIALLCLTAAISVTKLPYPLLLVLLLLLPQKIFGGNKARWKLLAGCAAVAIIIGVSWLLWARASMIPYGPTGADPSSQIKFLLTHPLDFAAAITTTFFTPKGDGFIQPYVISVGPVVAWLPVWLTCAYTLFLAASLTRLRSASAAVLQRGQRYIVALAMAGILGMIALLLYISWTPVGAPFIDGGQARYFTPLILLLVPLLTVRTSKGQQREGLLHIHWYRYVPPFMLVVSVISAMYYFYELHALSPF